MEVRANILNNPKGLTWDVTANLSSVANKIVKLPYNGNPNNRVGGYEVATGRKKADGTDETKWIAGRQEGGKQILCSTVIIDEDKAQTII